MTEYPELTVPQETRDISAKKWIATFAVFLVAAGALFGALAIVFATSGYQPVESLHDWGLLICMGLVGGFAVLALINAYRLARPSSLSPYEYFGIPFAFFLGWVFFDEAPFEKLIPGVFLIVAGGMLIALREHHIRRRPSSPDSE